MLYPERDLSTSQNAHYQSNYPLIIGLPVGIIGWDDLTQCWHIHSTYTLHSKLLIFSLNNGRIWFELLEYFICSTFNFLWILKNRSAETQGMCLVCTKLCNVGNKSYITSSFLILSLYDILQKDKSPWTLWNLVIG